MIWNNFNVYFKNMRMQYSRNARIDFDMTTTSLSLQMKQY